MAESVVWMEEPVDDVTRIEIGATNGVPCGEYVQYPQLASAMLWKAVRDPESFIATVEIVAEVPCTATAYHHELLPTWVNRVTSPDASDVSDVPEVPDVAGALGVPVAADASDVPDVEDVSDPYCALVSMTDV